MTYPTPSIQWNSSKQDLVNKMENRKKSIFDDLCNTLTKELQIYEDLLGAMKMKQNAIIKGNNDKIKDAIHQERKASQNILRQMEMRNELTQSISSESKIRDKKITLTTLIHKANAENKSKLEKIRRKMHLSVIEIDKLNSENKYLLSASITHVKDLVKVFLSAGDKLHSHYGINGSIKEHQKDNRVLDFRI